MSYVCVCANGKTWGAGNEGCNDNASNCAQCCSGGYGGVGGMMSPAYGSGTNTQGQMAPAGYHYMPDGSLMSDVEHRRLYGSVGGIKKIHKLNLDLSDIAAGGENKSFSITGDTGAKFSLEIKNEDNYYYNFQTNNFQAAKTRLDNETIFGRMYNGNIRFPKVGDNDQYDIYLFAEGNTKHADYREVRFSDGSLDINSSTGSNSLLLQKVIYQYTDVTVTISTNSPNSTFTLTVGSDTITTSRGKEVAKIPFSTTATVAADKALVIGNQPGSKDVMTVVTRDIGDTPDNIYRENVYPAVSNTDTVDGAVTSGVKVVMDTNVATKMVVGDRITTAVTTDTVDGAVTSGIKVVMDNNVATKMAVADRITGNAYLDANIVTVAALNPDTDNVKEFSMSEAVALADGNTLTFNSKLNYKGETDAVTVVALDPDEDNAKEFSMSSAVALRDGATLSFSNRKNYRWPLDNIDGLSPGMTVLGTNVTTGTTISPYKETLTTYENEKNEETIIIVREDALDTLSKTPTIVAGLVTVQPGNICFNKQQPLLLAGDTIRIYGYDYDAIETLVGYEIELSDLKVELTKVTTTTTSVVSNSTSVPITSRNGILDNVSTVSGIGINASVANPTVASGAGAVSGAGTIVLSAAQTLENGITLTFPGASRIATITGNIEIKKVGTSNITLNFDVEKFLKVT